MSHCSHMVENINFIFRLFSYFLLVLTGYSHHFKNKIFFPFGLNNISSDLEQKNLPLDTFRWKDLGYCDIHDIQWGKKSI